MDQLRGAYGGGSDSEDGEEQCIGLAHGSVPLPLTTAPRPVEVDLVQPQDEVQIGCVFKLGDHVYDDVFGCEGVVFQLPLESEAHNRGKILVKLDGEPGEPVWRTWGHCTVRAAAVASARPTLSQRPSLQRPREETVSEQLGPHAKKVTTLNNFFERVSSPAAGGARSAAPRAAAAAAGASSSAAPRAPPRVSGVVAGGASLSAAAAGSEGSSAAPRTQQRV